MNTETNAEKTTDKASGYEPPETLFINGRTYVLQSDSEFAEAERKAIAKLKAIQRVAGECGVSMVTASWAMDPAGGYPDA